MDEASSFWIIGFLLAVWRFALKTHYMRARADKLERWIIESCSKVIERFEFARSMRDGIKFGHHFAVGSPILEWWFIGAVLLTYFAFRGFVDICLYEYGAYHFLLSTRTFNFTAKIESNFDRVHYIDDKTTTFENLTLTSSQLQKEVYIPFWLSGLAMSAPIVGIGAYIIFLVHFYNLVLTHKIDRVKASETLNTNDKGLFMVGTHVRVKVSDGSYRNGTILNVDATDVDDELPYKVEFHDKGDKHDNDEEVPEVAFVKKLANWRRYFKTGAEDPRTQTRQTDWVSGNCVEQIQEDSNPWVADQQEELALIVVMMPAVFIVMAMKAEIRILEVMTGSQLKDGQVWSEYELPLVGTYRADLEIAAATQYLTVFAFAVLCTKFFNLRELEKMTVNRENHFFLKVNQLIKNSSLSPAERDDLLKPDGKTKEEIFDQIRRKSEQHWFITTLAGLLGVWSYIFVGVFRCIFNITIAVLQESKRGAIRIWIESSFDSLQRLQDAGLSFLQPVFFTTMALCIVNMGIVLRMDELTSAEAFGKNANLKFIACRGLLIIADGQSQSLQKLAGNLKGFSVYQANLLHVSLLMMESMAVILFNSFRWRRTVRMRSIKAHQIAVDAAKGKKASGLNINFGVLDVLRSRVFLFTVAFPTSVMCFVLASATLTGGGPKTNVPYSPISKFNGLFENLGPALVIPFFGIRVFLAHRDLDFLTPTHNSRFNWLPQGWVRSWFVIWALVSWIRFIIFTLVHPFNKKFSDHIFLQMSILTLVEMELGVCYIAWKRSAMHRNLWSSALISFYAVFFVVLMWNCWYTAMYYHTPEAVWLAFFAGTLFFGMVSVWWLLLLSHADCKKAEHDSKVEPLLDG